MRTSSLHTHYQRVLSWGDRMRDVTTPKDDDDVEINVLGCRVDILGRNCDQCVSMVQSCFTSTETVRHIRTGSPGRPPRLSHSSWTLMTAPKLAISVVNDLWCFPPHCHLHPPVSFRFRCELDCKRSALWPPTHPFDHPSTPLTERLSLGFLRRIKTRKQLDSALSPPADRSVQCDNLSRRSSLPLKPTDVRLRVWVHHPSLSLSLSICLSLSLSLSVCLSLSSSLSLSLSVSVSVPVCLSLCPSVSLSLSLSVCLPLFPLDYIVLV